MDQCRGSLAKGIIIGVLAGVLFGGIGLMLPVFSLSKFSFVAAALLLLITPAAVGIQLAETSGDRARDAVIWSCAILWGAAAAVVLSNYPRNELAHTVLILTAAFVVGGTIAVVFAKVRVNLTRGPRASFLWLVMVGVLLISFAVDSYARSEVRREYIGDAQRIAQTVGIALPSDMRWDVLFKPSPNRTYQVLGAGEGVAVKTHGAKSGLRSAEYMCDSGSTHISSEADASAAIISCPPLQGLRIFCDTFKLHKDGGEWVAETHLAGNIFKRRDSLRFSNAILSVHQDGTVDVQMH